MKFVICDENLTHKIVVDVNNFIKFNLDSKVISMEAGGYLLCSQPNEWQPTAFSFDRDVNIFFKTVEEAQRFALWLNDTNEESNKSYTRMLD